MRQIYNADVLVVGGGPAGIAGAMSVVKKCMPRELNVKELQDGLTKDGVDLTRGGMDQNIKS